MREWKGRGGPGESTRGSRGGSNVSRRPDTSGRRGRSGGNWGNGGNDWQENDYDEPPAGRSSRRNRRPAESYDEVDLGRALVPARNEMMAPMDASAGLPAVPGFPQTDEEERALGMRRPAYIPATTEKRKKKLSSWRVISGVLSVMLACIASCGAAGILGRDRIATIFGNPVKLVGTQIPLDLSNVPVTPVATPGPAAKSLTQVTTALHRQGNCVPVDPTSYFHNGDIIWVFVTMKTQAPGHSISVRWFLNGTYVDPPVQGPGHTVTVLKDGEAGACFQLQVPTPGEGTARLYWDRPANDVGDNPSDPALLATIYFAVVPPGYGTVTPGANGTTAPTAAPTGSPSK